MLFNITHLKTRIQWQHDGLFTVDKVHGGHLQRMVEMSSVHALAELFNKKVEEN